MPQVSYLSVSRENTIRGRVHLCSVSRLLTKQKRKLVGGKGTNPGELSRIEAIHTPDGFCISTEVLKRTIGKTSSIKKGYVEIL